MSGPGAALPLVELPRGALDALGAGGGLEALALLRPARRSRNLLLLRGLRERAHAVEPAGRAAARVRARLDAGLDLLRDVQRQAPAVFAEVVDDPMTGAWLGCWARGAPLARSAAEAASLAAAAAHRAGLGFRIEVPVRSGAVMLPGLGVALLPGDAETAEVVGEGGRCRVAGGAGGSVAVPDGHWGDGGRGWSGERGRSGGSGGSGGRGVRGPADGRPDWYGLRRLRCDADGRTWSFALDSLNPFRIGRDPVAPRLLDAEEAARWEAELSDAWRLLVRRHPDRAAEVGRTVEAVVPLGGETSTVDDRGGWLSATLGDAVGMVALARHTDVRSLAAGLVHEVQHSKLCALLDVTDLLGFPPGTRCYSPWREDPRPPSALLQGAYAFMAVAGFWRDEAAAAAPAAVRAAAHGVPPGTEPDATRDAAPRADSEAAPGTSADAALRTPAHPAPQTAPDTAPRTDSAAATGTSAAGAASEASAVAAARSATASGGAGEAAQDGPAPVNDGAPQGTSAEVPPQTRFAQWYGQTRGVVSELLGSDWPTGDGRRFLTAMRRTLDAWADPEPGPRHVRRATAAAAEHRVRWRLRHLPPPRRAVELLAAARAAGEPAPAAAAALLPTPGALPPDRWRLPAGTPSPDTARAAADLEALLSAREPGSPEQWAALASLALLLADPRATALAAMPELVRAVHAALARPAPGERGSHRQEAEAPPAAPVGTPRFAPGSPLDLARWLRPVIEGYPAGPAA